MENQIQNGIEKSKGKQFLLEWILPFTAAIIFALLINKYVFFNIKVPTESMYPTIKIGDRLMVTKVYRPEKLQRGDLIVFTIPENKDRLIKRLIGRPGDVVEIAMDGKVSVNGEKLDESYVKNPGGIAGRTYKVPEDSYFVLGDNRANSLDGRYWIQSSFVKGEDIIGKARFTIYPFNRIGGV